MNQQEAKLLLKEAIGPWQLSWADIWDSLFGPKRKVDDKVDIHREPVASSNIHSIGYDPNSRTMEVMFNNKGLYRYPNVRNWQFEDFKSSPSKGKYFAKHFRREKDFKKVAASIPYEHKTLVPISVTKIANRELLKQAISFIATRNVIRSLKADPLVIPRMNKNPNIKYQSPIWRDKNQGSALTNIQNFDGNIIRTLSVNRGNRDPRSALFHEYGHYKDPNVMAKTIPDDDTIASSYIPYVDPVTLQKERMANQNAVSFMNNQKVPETLIDRYKQVQGKHFKSYIQQFRDNRILHNEFKPLFAKQQEWVNIHKPIIDSMISEFRSKLAPHALNPQKMQEIIEDSKNHITQYTQTHQHPEESSALTKLRESRKAGILTNYSETHYPAHQKRIIGDILKKIIPNYRQKVNQHYFDNRSLYDSNAWTPA